MNTVNGTPSDGSNHAGNIALPDNVREDIYRGAGVASLFNVAIHELRELGANRKFAQIFGNYSTGTPSFSAATNDLVLGFDLNQDVFLRPVLTDEAGGKLVTKVDDQFYTRSEKIGWYMKMKENRTVLDNRPLTAIIV